MSTRCNIAIVLKDSDKDRKLNLLEYAEETGFDLKNRLNDALSDEVVDETFKDKYVVSDGVLQIYCHHDGYPEGVGVELLKHFNSYEEALALILAGDTSYLDEGKSGIYAFRESYDDDQPMNIEAPTQFNDYLYTWKDGEWKIGESMKSLKETLEYWII